MRTVETECTKVLQIIDRRTVRVLKPGALTGTVMHIPGESCPRNIFDGNTREELEAFIRTANACKYVGIEDAAIAAMRACGQIIYKDPPTPPPSQYKIVSLMDSRHFVGEKDGKKKLVAIGKREPEDPGDMAFVSLKELYGIIKQCSPRGLEQLGIQMSVDEDGTDEFKGLRTMVKKMFQAETTVLEWLNFNKR